MLSQLTFLANSTQRGGKNMLRYAHALALG
jgi:hypothetical protein